MVDFGYLLSFQETGLIVEVPGLYVHYQALAPSAVPAIA